MAPLCANCHHPEHSGGFCLYRADGVEGAVPITCSCHTPDPSPRMFQIDAITRLERQVARNHDDVTDRLNEHAEQLRGQGRVLRDQGKILEEIRNLLRSTTCMAVRDPEPERESDCGGNGG